MQESEDLEKLRQQMKELICPSLLKPNSDWKTLNFKFRLVAKDIELNRIKNLHVENGYVFREIGHVDKRNDPHSVYSQLLSTCRWLNEKDRTWVLCDRIVVTVKRGKDKIKVDEYSASLLFQKDEEILEFLDKGFELEAPLTDRRCIIEDFDAADRTQLESPPLEDAEAMLERLASLDNVPTEGNVDGESADEDFD